MASEISFSTASSFRSTGGMNVDLESFERLTVPKPWPDEEIKRLFHLRNVLGRDWSEIAIDLGRTESGVKSKFKYATYERETKQPSVPFVREPVPDTVLVDRAKRLGSAARDLTASILGDPIPGWSALERVR